MRRPDLGARNPRAGAGLVLCLLTACAGGMRVVRVTTDVPPEVWLPDRARSYLEDAGFTVSIPENTSNRIQLVGNRDELGVRSVVYVTMTAPPPHPNDGRFFTYFGKAEVRVLRYERGPDGTWLAADPEPLRDLAEQLAAAIGAVAGG